jgi:tRNA U34 5-carboxymethylaminomethyl modifying GTPase MnmE/TrmE
LSTNHLYFGLFWNKYLLKIKSQGKYIIPLLALIVSDANRRCITLIGKNHQQPNQLLQQMQDFTSQAQQQQQKTFQQLQQSVHQKAQMLTNVKQSLQLINMLNQITQQVNQSQQSLQKQWIKSF